MAELEKEIDHKDLHACVEEICSRERYKFNIASIFRRYFTCFDDERDEIVKKMRRNGDRKMLTELDISKISRKIRSNEAMKKYLLTERQKFLLKFNYNNVLDSETAEFTDESDITLFSADNTGFEKQRSIRQRVMVRLLEDSDFRSFKCAYRLLNRDLEVGVGKTVDVDSIKEEGEQSSSLVDSDRLENQFQKIDEAEIAPDIIGAAEPTPPTPIEVEKSSSVHESSYEVIEESFEEEMEEEQDPK